jgi:nucleotide-binding universal stress UspA family protein
MGDQRIPLNHRIVVGVDGTASSKAALGWAVQRAKLTDATVEAVIAWHYPTAFGGAPFGPIGSVMDTDFAGTAAGVLSEAISDTVDPANPVKVSSAVREGIASQILLDAADGAEMLVVGSRGHGGFTEALLGSVSQVCVHHARCPVVVVRGPKDQ